MNSDPQHDSETTAPADQADGTVRWRRWRKRGLVVVLLAAMVVALLPEALRFGLVAWLDRQPGLSARLNDIDLNPFTGLLRVEGLQVSRHGEDVLVAGLAEVQMAWWPLFKRRVDLQQVTVHDMVLLIEQLPETPLTIAGLALTEQDTLAEETAPPPTGAAWGISTGVITFRQVDVVLRNRHQDTRVQIDHLNSSPLVSWQPQQAGALDVSLNIAGGTLTCVGENRPFASPARTDLTVNGQHLDLETVAPLLSALGWRRARGRLDGNLHVQAAAAVESQPGRLKIDGQLSGRNLSAEHTAVWLKQLNLSWQGQLDILLGENLQLAGQNHLDVGPAQMELQQSGLGIAAGQLLWEGPLTLTEQLDVKGALQIDGLTVTDLARATTLVNIGRGQVGPFDFIPQHHLTVDDVSLTEMTLLGRGAVSAARQPQVVAVSRLDGHQLDWQPQQHLSIEQLHVSGLVGDLILLPGGAVEARQWLPQSPLTPASQETAETDEAPALAVVIGSITIDGNSQLLLEDKAVTPPVRLRGEDVRFHLGAFDSRQTDLRSPLSLDVRLDTYSRLQMQGDMALFAQPLSLNLTSELSEFQLPSVSAYVERSIGYRLEQGQLNLQLQGPVEQGVAALTSQFHLKRLQLRPLTGDDERAVGERLGLPVNMALSLLRDRRGDISLTIPVRGDLSRPDVAVGSIVRKAVVGAVKNTVAVTLAPLGIVAKAGQLVGIGGHLTFEPIVFEPGSMTLTPDSLAYLDRLKDLLEKRPQLTFSLCGQVNAADQKALQSADSAARQRHSEATTLAPLTPERIQQFAGQRAEQVKQLLLQGTLVKSSQLLLCNPPTQLSDGPASVMVRL
nr:DUF748 domain-containing protein [uncultured Desulfuromonas sp.]